MFYATLRSVLILSAFVGYHVAEMAGALAATVSVFDVPVLLVGLAAQLVAGLQDAPWFQALGHFAAAAVASVGLLGVSLVAFARRRAVAHPVCCLG